MITNRSQFNTVLCEIHSVLMKHRKTKHNDVFTYATVDISFDSCYIFDAFVDELRKDHVLAAYTYYELQPVEFPAVFRIYLQSKRTAFMPKFVNRRKFKSDIDARDRLAEYRRLNGIRDEKRFEEESRFMNNEDDEDESDQQHKKDLLKPIEKVEQNSLFYGIDAESAPEAKKRKCNQGLIHKQKNTQ